MSDTESVTTAPHPHLGGKTIQSLERPRYKSWRKKYRKMRHHFDSKFEDNRRLYKDEQSLEGIAKRLREELDGLLELCLDLNQSPNIPPEFRFDVSLAQIQSRTPSVVDANVTPAAANELLVKYTDAVHEGKIPALDLHVVRDQIEARLAAQDVENLHALELEVPHATITKIEDIPEELRRSDALGYMLAEQENEYLLRLDARLGDQFSLNKASEKGAAASEDKIWSAYSTHEQNRRAELMNPHSQHNWLKLHNKLPPGTLEAIDDNESLASHDRPERADPKPAPKKRANKNLAKQVGDRAVGRAREGWSPTNFGGYDDDDLAMEEVTTAKGKKKKDPDGNYRAKGGRSGTSKGKRKRSGEDVRTGSPADAASSKKARVESLLD